MSARRRSRRLASPAPKPAAGDDGAGAASGGGGSPALGHHSPASDGSSSGSSSHRPATRGVVAVFLRRVSGFLHHAAMHPRASLAWLWAAVVVMLVVSARLFHSEDGVDVQQWTGEEVQAWFDTYHGGMWKAHGAAFAGLDGANVAAMTNEHFEKKLASTGDAIFNDWRLYVDTAEAAGDAVSVQQWTAEEVQAWFDTYDGGMWKAHGAAFSGLNGKRLAAMTREGFKERLASTGDAIFNDWRLYVAAHSAWGVAAATLQQPWVAVLLVVAPSVSVWLVLTWAAAEFGVFEMSPEITAFLRSLEDKPKSNGEAEFLRLRGFVDMWNVFIADETCVFLRPCYTQLLEKLRSRTSDLEWITCKPRQLILGTPGTGKSYFRVVLARDLLFGEAGSSTSEEKAVNVVLVKSFDSAKADTVVNRKGVVLSRSGRGDLVGATIGRARIDRWCTSKVKAGERVVLIIDVSHGVQNLVISDPRVEVYTVSSNNESVEDTSEAEKRKFSAVLRLGGEREVEPIEASTMPLWDVGEALACHRVVASPLPEATVAENMMKYGMTARDAFRKAGGDAALEAHIKKAKVLDSDTTLGKLLGGGPSTWHRLAQDRLFQRRTDYDVAVAAGNAAKARVATFSQDSIEWRSNYVRDFVVGYCVTNAAAAVQQKITNPGREAGPVGSFVEGTYLLLMRAAQGSQLVPHFSFKAIGPSTTTDLSDLEADDFEAMNVRQHTWFATGDEEGALTRALRVLSGTAGDSATLLQPYDTRYPAIDAVLLVWRGAQLYVVLLQVTIAATHPTRRVAAATLQRWVTIARRQGARFGLAFVLPPGRYESYVKQRVDHHVDAALAQYALCVTNAGL